jgi:hypothetical protein
MFAEATTTVAQANKIGQAPEGWFRDAAMALQQHVAADGRRASGNEEARPEGAWEAPSSELFVRARQACGFTAARYYATLGAQEGQKDPTLRLLGASAAAGRSGAFFFLSPDQQFIVKTCTRREWTLLLKILPDYVEHLEGARKTLKARKADNGMLDSVTANNTGRANSQDSQSTLWSQGSGIQTSLQGFVDTLLPRYLGLYRFQVKAGNDERPIRVVVMTNVFAGAESIDRRYDLKGSTHGRNASMKELSKKSPVYKDLDWQAKEQPLQLDPSSQRMIHNVLEQDSSFLARHSLIDYSLLVGLHDQSEASASKRRHEGMLVTTVEDSRRLAYIGVVDILTPYAAKKRAETFFLGQIFCGRDISCQPPPLYARRFLQYMKESVFQEKASIPEEQQQQRWQENRV